jgi:VanZ family protein
MPRYFRITSLWPGILWALFILLLCALPGSSLPKMKWTSLFQLDKAVHIVLWFFLYAMLLLGLWSKLSMRWGYAVIIAAVLSIGYGFLTEWMQENVFRDRTADWMDIVANSTGVIIGVIVSLLYPLDLQQQFSLRK